MQEEFRVAKKGSQILNLIEEIGITKHLVYSVIRALIPLFGNGARAIQIGKINVILGKIGKTNIQGEKKLNKFCFPRVLLLICFQ
jgi:hypothetical protein